MADRYNRSKRPRPRDCASVPSRRRWMPSGPRTRPPARGGRSVSRPSALLRPPRLRRKFLFEVRFGGAEVEMGESISQRNRVDDLVFSPRCGYSQVPLFGTGCYRKPGIGFGFRSRENAICLVEKGKNLLSQWHGAFCDMKRGIFFDLIYSILLPPSPYLTIFNLPRSGVYLMS